MYKNFKLLSSMESLSKEAMGIADSFLSCKERGIEPGREHVIRVYILMAKVEKILGKDIDLDKYPTLKADYIKWKQNRKLKKK